MIQSVILAFLFAIVLAVDAFSRHNFPPDFVFGASTSAYQVFPSDLPLFSLFMYSFYVFFPTCLHLKIFHSILNKKIILLTFSKNKLYG